jgi:hypothetical protein
MSEFANLMSANAAAVLRCRPVIALLVMTVILSLTDGNSSLAVTLNPIPTIGHDQDIVYEAGLAAGAIGATGEIDDRQFYETGIYTIGAPAIDRGLPQTLPAFISSLAPNNVINFAFQPFEGNNVLKFDATTSPVTAKSLNLASPDSFTDLAIVFSAGSILEPPRRFSGWLGYTIHYVGGATQTGQFEAIDWGSGFVPPGVDRIFNADRAGSFPPPAWPVTPNASANATRWSVFAGQVATTLPGESIASVSFNAMLSDGTSVLPLTDSMDIVVFGVAGAKTPSILLQVDTRTGQVQLHNPTAVPIGLNGYELTSAAGSLSVAGWNSFSDQHLDPVDGPDFGSEAGDGVGETWNEAGGASGFGLQEGFLFGNTMLPAGATLLLGAAFDPVVAAEDLIFKFRRTDGTIIDGSVEYVESSVPGDFDGDSDVDADDLIVWRENFGSTTADPRSGDADGDGDADGGDFLAWQRNLTGPLASNATVIVPEPCVEGLVIWTGCTLATACLRRRAMTTYTGRSLYFLR